MRFHARWTLMFVAALALLMALSTYVAAAPAMVPNPIERLTL